MTRDELTLKIRTSAILREHFRRGQYHVFCPCCVDRVMAFADQSEVERVIQAISFYGNRIVELEEHQDPPPLLQTQHQQDSEEYRLAVVRLYEIFRTPVEGMLSFDLAHDDDL